LAGCFLTPSAAVWKVRADDAQRHPCGRHRRQCPCCHRGGRASAER
jgi:hypothetical protein